MLDLLCNIDIMGMKVYKNIKKGKNEKEKDFFKNR